MSQTLISGPHTLASSTVSRTMLWVMVALLPATLWGLYLFGWPAINLFAITLASALLFEAACLYLAGRPVQLTLFDGSALLTAWLLAMSLPPWAPWWVGVLGSFIAIVIGKQVFGGLGHNLFNPAMVARVALLVSFPLQLTSWTAPAPLFADGSPGFIDGLAITFGGLQIDGFSGASLLGEVKTEFTTGKVLSEIMPGGMEYSGPLWGHTYGSLGETSALLILAGGLLLVTIGLINWTIPASMLGSVALLATLMNLVDPEHYPDAGFHLFSGALMLGAFFIATDMVTSPNTWSGQLLFGAGCGALVYVIRTWGGYPEGVAFAVLLMNALTPLIDYYIKPRIYGRDRRGNPLTLDKVEGDHRAKEGQA
ncbi:RnfABCDGE type electron transport complex subunit D [Motiliproteus sediminis]|uniref:RnfABCDGE type electron transport complex subunit D n=1 Tax=Motiliproteus sediminis TaxID=1468178 RepID=UPI001AEFD528|nr:RnfABCDGE type electron transport complex subunit D [Motiliproteus sediminis]